MRRPKTSVGWWCSWINRGEGLDDDSCQCCRSICQQDGSGWISNRKSRFMKSKSVWRFRRGSARRRIIFPAKLSLLWSFRNSLLPFKFSAFGCSRRVLDNLPKVYIYTYHHDILFDSSIILSSIRHSNPSIYHITHHAPLLIFSYSSCPFQIS